MIPNRTIGACGEATEKAWQLMSVQPINDRSRIYAVGNLVTQFHCERKSLNRLSGRAILPTPQLVNVRQPESVGDEQPDIFGVRSVESTELTTHGRVQRRPESEGWRSRAD